MLSMLVAYDAVGNVIATLDYCAIRDEDGNVVGLVDFDAHEQAGLPLTDIWVHSDAAGSGTWPEWIGGRAHDFKVERSNGRIVALVHKESGHRRERKAIEDEFALRRQASPDGRIDARDLVGGPDRPLRLDEKGRTHPRKGMASPGHLARLSVVRGNAKGEVGSGQDRASRG